MTDKEEVVERLLGTKEFYVDFESWHIKARDKEHAYQKAKDMLKEGEIPKIIEVGGI